MLNSNAFGQLVRSYREQRGWTQQELAERWGYARAYLSQIERGQRKLDSMTQVMRLADILDMGKIAFTGVQGVRYNLMARLSYDSGDEQGFLRTITPALELAEDMKRVLPG